MQELILREFFCKFILLITVKKLNLVRYFSVSNI